MAPRWAPIFFNRLFQAFGPGGVLVALFAGDSSLLGKYFLGRLLDDCSAPADAYDLIGGRFEGMNIQQNPDDRLSCFNRRLCRLRHP